MALQRRLDYSCTTDTTCCAQDMVQYLDPRVIRRVAAEALTSGSGVVSGPGKLIWHTEGKCKSPVIRELTGRQRPDRPLAGCNQSILIDIHARCRVCVECRRHRARLWSARAADEVITSARTWFGTLTLSPASHYTMLARAAMRPGEDEFASRHREISKEITKFLKRVRKESGARFRYIIVAERHQSGLPHYHMLLHEMSVMAPVRERTLSGQWKLGFSQFRLVSIETGARRTARYVSKYLAKSSEARVRASRWYGKANRLKSSLDIVEDVPNRDTCNNVLRHEAEGSLQFSGGVPTLLGNIPSRTRPPFFPSDEARKKRDSYIGERNAAVPGAVPVSVGRIQAGDAVGGLSNTEAAASVHTASG